MSIEIEKNVPLPYNRFEKMYYNVYDKMEVGDSVLLDNRAQLTMLWEAVKNVENSVVGKLKSRSEGNKFRVWRIGERK